MGRLGQAVGLVAGAIGLATGADPALAGHATAEVQTYNATLIHSTNGVFTVSGAMNPTYIADAGLEAGTRLTVTLPDTFRFAIAPALTATVNGVLGAVTGSVVAGGAGARAITFQLSGAVNPGDPLTLVGSSTGLLFRVEAGLALAQPTAAPLPLLFQATGNVVATRNDPVPVTVPAFQSSPGVALTIGARDVVIDLNPPSLGALFLDPSGVDLAVSYLGHVRFATDGSSLAPNGSPFTLAATDTTTLTVAGAFAHLTGAYLDPVDENCSVSLPAGAISGTVSAGGLSFAGVAPEHFYGLCVITSGQALLLPNPPGTMRLALAGTERFGQTTFIDPAGMTYVGGVVTPRLTFITGSDAGYSTLVSVTNQGATQATLYVWAEPFTGGAPLAGQLGTLAAGNGQVFTEAQIGTVTGLALANSGQRAVIQVIGVGTTDLTASSLLVNPGGVVVNVQ